MMAESLRVALEILGWVVARRADGVEICSSVPVSPVTCAAIWLAACSARARAGARACGLRKYPQRNANTTIETRHSQIQKTRIAAYSSASFDKE
jgi:hypothetical protein